MKDYKCMVNLKDFPFKHVHSLGWCHIALDPLFVELFGVGSTRQQVHSWPFGPFLLARNIGEKVPIFSAEGMIFKPLTAQNVVNK